MTTEPTDDELAKLFTEETGFDVDDFPAAILDFARAVLAKWGTPQPDQSVPPAGREPLTVEQVNAILLEAGYGTYNAPVPERAAFISGLRHSERVHGINAKEAGNAE